MPEQALPPPEADVSLEVRKLRSSIEALGSTFNIQTVRCERHEDFIREQKEVNRRREEQITKLQDSGFGVHAIVRQLSTEFKEERRQTREAINAIALALEHSEKLQDDRHEKTLAVQQKNLDANLSLLKIFQDHQSKTKENLGELENKIVVNRIGHKALIGLGLGLALLTTGFITSMFVPPVDTAIHAAVATFVKLLPWHW